MPNIIAVIVTHNRPEALKAVVSSLLSQTIPLSRALLIDNASTPLVKSYIFEKSTLEIIRSEKNLGGAGGFALGLDAAMKNDVDWIWMMDDDAVPHNDALEKLLIAASQLPADTGALCSSVYEFGVLATMHRRTFGNLVGVERPIPVSAYSRDYLEIDTGSFVGFMVRKSAAVSSGLPNKDLFLAYDDTDYSLRLKANGWKLWLVPDSKIEHLRIEGSKLKNSDFNFKHFYNIRNRIYVVRKYAVWRRLAGIIGLIFGILIWAIARKSFNLKSFRLLNQAIIDGWQGKLGMHGGQIP